MPVKTIFVLMFENRSFDHLLGHLSLMSPTMPVDGLRGPAGFDPLSYKVALKGAAYVNVSTQDLIQHYPFHRDDSPLDTDLPHGRSEIAIQLHAIGNSFAMDGFVDAYYAARSTRDDFVDPMGFFTPREAWMTDFLAHNFVVCDRWFAPLPTSTQPNRLMLYSGTTQQDDSGGLIKQHDPTVFDWMTQNGITWRIYHDDVPWVGLMTSFWPQIAHDLTTHKGKHFRNVAQLLPDISDVATGAIDPATGQPFAFPQVVFIDPSYGDSPVHPWNSPNDNHPPIPIGPGEHFLRQIYQILTTPIANGTNKVWQDSALIVTYDEHGGLYDHVPPLPVTYAARPTFAKRDDFTSTGPRVPGLIVSPFVAAGSVYSKALDHTAILEFIADCFGPKDAAGNIQPYSADVDARRQQFQPRGRISECLTLLAAPRATIPEEPQGVFRTTVDQVGSRTAQTPMQQGWEDAADGIINTAASLGLDISAGAPGLLQWKHNG